jgi:nickel/cobalt transporter (NiCoT) family protein
VALILAGFFAMGMIPVDTLDSIMLRSAFSRIIDKKGFRYMSFALSGAALTVAAAASYEVLTGSNILPELTGPILAGVIIGSTFAYAFGMSRRRRGSQVLQKVAKDDHSDSDKDLYFSSTKK